MKATELREKTDEELDQILIEATEDIMHFRLQMARGAIATDRDERNEGRSQAGRTTIRAERRRDATAAPAGGGE